MAPIYLDYAATTPCDPAVIARMSAFLGEEGAFANPSSAHGPGQVAAQAVARARAQVAALINAEPEGLVWTSGATEANNLALLGALRLARARGRGGQVVTGATEHPSVLAACAQLEREGVKVTRLFPDAGGVIAPEAVAAALRDDTALVSLMHVNNETGAVQDVAAMTALAHAAGALMHVDAVQAAGRLPIDVTDWGVDLLSLSAHKLYGPKGVGVLYRRARPLLRLAPLVHGGGQEQGLRSGTLATHQIVGMGEACALAAARLPEEAARLYALKTRLREGLLALGAVQLNGPEQGAPHILNLAFGCVHGEALAEDIGAQLAVSAGSACSAVSGKPSPVLRAMGVPDALAHASLRFSLGRGSTERDVDAAVEIVSRAVHRLRACSPLWRDFQAGASLRALYAGDRDHGLV
ncbi:cysteine desulfurase family protein [Alkalilimnicola sp. S0819]|uniref:cysteine desulfurase family protein n=1 Tax=Alkalilimnicola sp. S0819 TaxID=2613922 RepID=UPI00126157DD|nr:cysteine desulfurase family protein [Alkalilimnicola sp. S0819]KAB7628396.1 cysteine desulfurase [Alkalilimnicola sp. S0819]MPQ15299.1 aminotransferase class V-fold PLP-dependent enzyme [Alkalilimnicola sp. S0819]